MDTDSIFGKVEIAFIDYYGILEIKQDAHIDDIKKSYKDKVLLYHPDKNPNSNTRESWDLLSTAYHVLSTQELRDKYDTRYEIYKTTGKYVDQNVQKIEGNEIWQAFETFERYQKSFDVLNHIPDIEKQFNLPSNSIRFKEGRPCFLPGNTSTSNSHNCHEIIRIYEWVDSLDPKSSDQNSEDKTENHPQKIATDKIFLLCTEHCYLHLCDEECTNEQDFCVMLAHWAMQQWLKSITLQKSIRESWSMNESHSQVPGKHFWFNAVTGEARWEEPKELKLSSTELEQLKLIETNPEPIKGHVCKMDKCLPYKYTKILDVVWACNSGKIPHICSYSQCNFRRIYSDGKIKCWATGKFWGALSKEDNMMFDAKQLNTDDLDRNSNNMAVEMRTLEYKKENGSVVKLDVEVPWGLKIGKEKDLGGDMSEMEVDFSRKIFERIGKQMYEREVHTRKTTKRKIESSEEKSGDKNKFKVDLETIRRKELETLKKFQEKDFQFDTTTISGVLERLDLYEYAPILNQLCRKSLDNFIDLTIVDIQDLNFPKSILSLIWEKIKQLKNLRQDEDIYDNVVTGDTLGTHSFYQAYVAPSLDHPDKDTLEEREGEWDTMKSKAGGREMLLEQKQADEDPVRKNQEESERLMLSALKKDFYGAIENGETLGDGLTDYNLQPKWNGDDKKRNIAVSGKRKRDDDQDDGNKKEKKKTILF